MSARDPEPRPRATMKAGMKPEEAVDLLAASGVSVARYKIDVHEYHRMGRVGILPPGARVELIQGEIIAKAPMASRHYWCVAMLARLLHKAVGDRAIVACQGPVRLSTHDEPEPDFALLKPETPRGKGLPKPADCLLVIEVADSSLPIDLKLKCPLYAQRGLPEYWVVNLPEQQLHVFRGPAEGAWAESLVIPSPGLVPLPGLPGVHIDLQGVF